MLRLGTGKCGWGKLLATNDSSSSFASRIPTLTKPTANCIFREQPIIENVLMLIFFGTGNNNTTFDTRIIGWNQEGGASQYPLWIPTPLVQFSCTLSQVVGVANAEVVAADRFVDTISAATWNPAGGSEIVSPANDTIAHAIFDAKGCDLIQIDFDMTGATDGNALYRWL